MPNGKSAGASPFVGVFALARAPTSGSEWRLSGDWPIGVELGSAVGEGMGGEVRRGRIGGEGTTVSSGLRVALRCLGSLGYVIHSMSVRVRAVSDPILRRLRQTVVVPIAHAQGSWPFDRDLSSMCAGGKNGGDSTHLPAK